MDLAACGKTGGYVQETRKTAYSRNVNKRLYDM